HPAVHLWHFHDHSLDPEVHPRRGAVQREVRKDLGGVLRKGQVEACPGLVLDGIDAVGRSMGCSATERRIGCAAFAFLVQSSASQELVFVKKRDTHVDLEGMDERDELDSPWYVFGD